MLTPGRIQASFFWSREDVANSFMGMGDSRSKTPCKAASSDKLDSEVMEGTNGLLTGTSLSNQQSASGRDFLLRLHIQDVRVLPC